MIIKFKKVISLIVINCFLLSFVYGQLIATAISNEQATQQYKQIFSDFLLPYSYGKITDAHFSSTDRVVINIQDLHCHPKVQKNISNIIALFDKQYGVKNIYLEGAYGNVDTSWISKSLDSSRKNEVMEKMVETGRLTGAEYFSATSGKTEIIKGLEKKEPYLENLKRFGDILEKQEKINIIMQAVKQTNQDLKAKYYDRRQLKLEQLSKDYTEENISAEKYFTLLSKHIDRLGIDIYKYENTLNFMSLITLQKGLKYSDISQELQVLILLLKDRLPENAYKMLADSTENFSQVDKLYGYLIKIARQYNLDLSVNFSELDKYFQYIELSQKINPLQLLEENQRLTNEINSRFSQTKAQMNVVFLINFEKYLNDYLTSKITSDDYEYYKKNIGEYKKLWAKYVDNKVLSLLDEYIAEADKFYVINAERNTYFTDNIFNEVNVSSITPTVQAQDEISKIIENMSEVKRVDVIITGGFHTGTVSEILKNHNVSYIVITPNVTDGIKMAEDTYYKVAKEQSKISFQALANLVASLSPVDQKKILVAADPSLANDLGLIVDQTQESILDQNQITELSNMVKMAKTLLSDDGNDITQKIIENIKDNLSQNKDLANQVDADLLKYVNIDKLQKALQGTEEGLAEIIEYSIKIKEISKDTTLSQSLAMVKEVFDNMKQIIDVLQKVTIKESVSENIKKVFSSKQKNLEFEYNDGDVKLILLEMPDGNNYAVNIIHCGRYHMMGLEKENESAAVSGFGNALSSQDTEKLFGLKIQIRENGKWTDLTKKASQYKADKLRIIRTKNYQAKTKLSVVNPTDVSYKPAGKQLSQSQSDESQAAIKNITNTNERRTVYLEDINSDSESFENNIIQAVDNHDLLVIYPLKNNINSEQLSTGELFDAYNFILYRIGDFSRVISSLLMSKYGFKTSTQFFFAEILKNAFIHGNKLKTNLPIYIDFTGNQIKIYNAVDPKIESTQRERFVFTATGGSGFKSGINFMQIGKKSGEEQKKLMREFSLLGYSDNLDMLQYSSNPEVKSDGKVFYEAVINIDASQPSFSDVSKTSENMRPYERMAESSNKADLAEEIFNDLIGFAYFENADGKTGEQIHRFYDGIIVKEVNNYFNTLSLEQRKKYIDKNKEKTKELFNEDKSKIAKEIENKIMTSREGLEQFIRSKGYDADKGHIQEIISDITSKGLFLNPEEIIKRVQAGEENSLRFTLLQNTVGITGINDELAEFVLANAGLTLEEFKEKADKEYGTINDKSWNLELKKYEQENSLSGENKLSPGEEMQEASNKAAVTEQIFENLIGSDALETEDEDLQDEMLIFFNEIIMEAVNDYFESMSVSQRRKYLDTASFDKVKGKIAKNLETEILGTYEGLEQFIKAKGYDAGQNYIQNLITNIVNGKFVMSPVEIIGKIEQKRENLLRFNMVQKTIGITGEETNNNIAKFVLQNSSLPIEEFKVKADKEFRGINEDLWNKELKKYMQIKAGMLPDLEFPEYGLSQQEISDISQLASKSKSYQEFISSVGAKYGKKTLGISRTRQGRYAKGYYNKKHDVSVEFGDCDGVSGTWAQLNDQDNGIIDYSSQDIKFHISASPENAKEIYDLVRPILDKYNMTFKVAVNTGKLQMLKNTQVGKFITIYLPEEESLQVLVDLGVELDAVLSSYNNRNKSPEILNEIKLGSSGILTVRDEAMKRGVEIDKQTRALQFTDFFNKSKTELVKIWDTRTESKAVTAEYNTQSVKKALDKMGVILPPEYNLDKFVSGETIRLDLPPEEWAEGVAGKLKSKLGLQGIENQPVQSPKATKQVMRPEVRFELIEEIEQGLNDMGVSWALEPENIDATMELITQEMLNSDKPVGDMINTVAGKLDAKRYGADEEIDFMKMFEEEFANIGKKRTDNKTSSTESLIKESINPISLITRTAVKIVTAKEISDELAEKILEDKINYDIKSNLIIIDSNEQAQKLREQGFNVASVRIADSKEIKRGKKGIVIGERDGKQIRAYLDKINGELLFYSKINLQDMKMEDLKILFQQAQLNGINDDLFKGVEQVVMVDKATDLETIINRIKNAKTDSISRPAISINLDFSNRSDVTAKNIEKISNGETNNGLDANTIIVNSEQLKAMDITTISSLQAKGYEIVLLTNNIEDAEITVNQLHINGAVIKVDGQITKEKLAKIKQIENNNVKGVEIIKTQMYIEGLSEESLTQIGDIYTEYGILPIVDNKSGYLQTNQKCSIRVTDKDNITDLLNKSNLASIITDKVNTVRQSTGKLSDIISDILKPATPRQKFKTEVKTIRNSEYEFGVNNLADQMKNKDSELFKLLTGKDWFEGEQETANEEKLKESINKLLLEDVLKGLTKDRVSKLMQENKPYEALACIRASAERTVESIIFAKLKTDNIEILSNKFKKYSGGLLRDSIMVLGIQLLAEGKDIGLLLEDKYISSDMTAQQYFESIIVALNGNMKDIVKTNEYRIETLENEVTIGNAAAIFKDLNILMQDQFRDKSVVKDTKISLLAVKGILGAA